MRITAHPQSEPKSCPFCAETIQAAAVKCRFCGEFLNSPKAKAIEANSQTDLISPQNQAKPVLSRVEGDNKILFACSPSLLGIIPQMIKALLLLGIAILIIKLPVENLLSSRITEDQAVTFTRYRILGSLAFGFIVLLILAIKIARLKLTYYEVTAERIEWARGIFDKKVDNLDMFRIVDLKLRRSVMDCIFGVGKVVLTTTDKSDPEFAFEKVRDSRKLYDVIKKASLEADRRTSVVHLE